MPEANLKVFRGEKDTGTFENYKVPIEEGMVVLDAIHYIQQNIDPLHCSALELQGSKVRILFG